MVCQPMILIGERDVNLNKVCAISPVLGSNVTIFDFYYDGSRHLLYIQYPSLLKRICFHNHTSEWSMMTLCDPISRRDERA
jgi:hypothetical protein